MTEMAETSERTDAVRVFLALGSNLGDRAGYLAAARDAIAALPWTRVIDASSIEETVPLGGKDQPAYLNQMVLVETALEPHALLEEIHRIEAEQGRVRTEHWGARTLDIDIVRSDELTLETADLVLPHPGLSDREFWQRELGEIEAHAE